MNTASNTAPPKLITLNSVLERAALYASDNVLADFSKSLSPQQTEEFISAFNLTRDENPVYIQSFVFRFAFAMKRYAWAAERVFEIQEKLLNRRRMQFYLWRDSDSGKVTPDNAFKVQKSLSEIITRTLRFQEYLQGNGDPFSAENYINSFGILSKNSGPMAFSLLASDADSLLIKIIYDRAKTSPAPSRDGKTIGATSVKNKATDARVQKSDIQIILTIIKEDSDFLKSTRESIIDRVRRRLMEITPGEGIYKNFSGRDREAFQFKNGEKIYTLPRRNIFSKIETALLELERQAGGQSVWPLARKRRP